MHERYAVRPKELEDMCLAQWAISYKPTSKVPKDTKFDSDHMSEERCDLTLYSNNEIHLPKYIILKHHNLGFMRVRAFQAILRIHNSSKKKESHEQFYAELLLYFPWRNEVECLKRNDAVECEKLYHSNYEEIIEKNKEKLCPYQSLSELATDVEDLKK